MNGIDLNCDLGESYGAFTVGNDADLAAYITSANVACGWHGGDPVVMEKTVAMAKRGGVAVGAHPSLPDLLGFGRREMKLTPEEAEAYIKYQLGALYAFCRCADVKLEHVKPHGALYTAACRDIDLARGVCRAARAFDPKLIILAPFGSMLETAARELELAFAGEFFADRVYNCDGSLAGREQEGAVICDPDTVCARVLRMAREGTVVCAGGEIIEARCNSVCIHGDNPGAAGIARALRLSLFDAGIPIKPLRELVR